MDDTVPDGPLDEAAPVGPPPQDAIPELLGRYRVERVIGAGMMGVVFEAFDPELDRRRAIKLMQPGSGRDVAKARARFLREAKAMAKLEHANVVAVFDVGTHGGRPFVVMEYIEGMTLEDWNRRTRPSWMEVLDKFRQAGRGLAAAHDAGFVHRDFKPANVLVAEDGSVKVTDFGLVRAAEEDTAADLAAQPEDVGADDLTRTGALMGTPAYMAPEQAMRRGADARSDQFAFCVSVYEALFRQRPFAGESLREVAANAEKGNLRRPESAEVDEWVFDVLERGLDPDPNRRWPNMAALLARLDRQRRRRSRWVTIGTATALAAVVGTVLFVARDHIRAWWSPVTVEVEVLPARLEAPMALAQDPAVGDYASSTVANKGRVSFPVELPLSGRYYLWGLVWEDALGGDRGDADSFFVYIDGGEEHLWHFGCQNEKVGGVGGSGHWRWQRVLDMPNADSDCELREVEFRLGAGRHHIVVRNREGADDESTAARIAGLVVTNDPNWVPGD